MFEAVKRLWLGAVLILTTSAFLLLSDSAERAGATPRAAILQYSSLEALDDGVRGLLDSLKDHGYNGRDKVIIDLFNAQNDGATNSAMASEIASGKYRFAITISTNCLQVMANANRRGKAIHLFGLVADPSAAKVGVSPKDPSDKPRHMTGIGTLMPVSEILKDALAMNPRLRRIGIPYNPSQANSLRYMELAREAAAELNLELLEGSVDNTAAVGEVTDSLVARGADTILTIADVTVGLGIDALAASANKGRIPVLGVAPNNIKHGVMYVAGADYYMVGRQVGDVAARLFAGEDPALIPVSYALPKTYGVNLKVPPTLKDRWVVPPGLIAKATVVVR
jgi:ABC-type uncharacterized transport system substrate-binding protein